MMAREEAIVLFEKQLTAAQVVLDSGFGSNPGENDSLYRRRKEMAEIALTALRPVSREQVEKVRGKWMHKEIQSSNSVTGYFKLPECECSNCGCIVQQEANFCPHCGEPKTDEAVEMVMERMEAIR